MNLKKINSNKNNNFARLKTFKGKIVRCTISRTYSNLFVVISDLNGGVLFYLSSGKFAPEKKNKKFKYNAFTSTLMGKEIGNVLTSYKINRVFVTLRTPLNDFFSKNVLKGMSSSSEIRIVQIAEFFNKAHNGCKPKKVRRN